MGTDGITDAARTRMQHQPDKADFVETHFNEMIAAAKGAEVTVVVGVFELRRLPANGVEIASSSEFGPTCTVCSRAWKGPFGASNHTEAVPVDSLFEQRCESPDEPGGVTDHVVNEISGRHRTGAVYYHDAREMCGSVNPDQVLVMLICGGGNLFDGD